MLVLIILNAGRKSLIKGNWLAKQYQQKVKKKNRYIGRCKNRAWHLKKGSWHLIQERQVKYKFIQCYKSEFSVEKMCSVFKVSKSGYYKWLVRTPSKREIYNQVLLEEIKRFYYQNKRKYGSPRIAKELEILGFKASKQLIRKLMKKAHLQSIIKTKV